MKNKCNCLNYNKMQWFKLFVLFLMLGLGLEAQEKYAIGMFHFNLQYVAGDYKIEQRINKESLYPVLQFFEKNPAFKSDIEIQGYAIEVLAEDYPQVLSTRERSGFVQDDGLKGKINRKEVKLLVGNYLQINK
jgi:hypothetical protein